MGKTSEQVFKYLSRRAYPEDDWRAIRAFCLKRYGSGARCSIRPKCESTVDEFMKWLEEGLGDGDIVTDEDGRVGVYYNDGVKGHFAAIMENGDVVVRKGVCNNPNKADAQVESAFYEAMAIKGLAFRTTLSCVVKLDVPMHGDRCRVMYKGKIHVGFFDCLSGRSARFVFLICDGELTRDVTLDLWGVDFMKNGASDIRCINDTLSGLGLMYDKGAKTLVEINSRQSKGGSYWYVSDKLTVMCVVDTGTMIHKARYECHNYFSSFEEAEGVRRLLLELGERRMKKGRR